ncbi:MAG: MBL fold metallo-hydrolase [Alicyclobacillus sp.]|nr:MBL fold metallo-hydrolase [Alicyclobacillus sp.]
MRVHVLGYWGAYPEPGEATTGFLLELPGGKVLLDCGSGVLSQLGKVCAIPDLAGVVVTHHHHDHAADLGTLVYAVLLARLQGQLRQPLAVYTPPGQPRAEAELRREPGVDWTPLSAGQQVVCAGATWSFVQTRHPVECLAVRVAAEGKVFAFSADSAFCPELTEVARGADVFLCEASFPDGQEAAAAQAGHLTAGQAGRVARQAGVRRLVLTHYPHGVAVEQLLMEASAAWGQPAERVYTLQRLEV